MTIPFSKALYALSLGLLLATAPAFAGEDDGDIQDEGALNCESLREKAGKLCNSLHPDNDKEFNKCFRKELDPRCRR